MDNELAALRTKRDALMVLLSPLEKLPLLAGSVQATEAKGQDLRAQVSAISRRINIAEAGNA